MIREKVPVKVAGVCGIVGPVVAALFIAISIFLHLDWWTWAGNTISDLGAIGVSYGILLSIGLIAAAVLEFVFVLGLPRLVKDRISLFGVGILLVGIVCLFFIGIFPDGTIPHDSFSIAFFSITSVSMFVLGAGLTLDSDQRGWGVFLLSIITLALIAFALNNTIPNIYFGCAINETIFVIAFSEFSMIFGARLLTKE